MVPRTGAASGVAVPLIDPARGLGRSAKESNGRYTAKWLGATRLLMNNRYGCGSAVGMRSNPSFAACDRSLNSDLILAC